MNHPLRSAASIFTAATLLLPVSLADEIRVISRAGTDETELRQTQTQSQSQTKKAVVIRTDEAGDDQRIEIEIERKQQTRNGEPQESGAANILIIGPEGKQEFSFPLDTDNEDSFQELRNRLLQQIPEEMQDRPEIRSLLQSLQRGFAPGAAISEEAPAESRMALGIQCEPPSAALRKHLRLRDAGVLITAVVPDSPAAEADLQPDDLLLRVGDNVVTDMQTLTELIAASNGDEIQLTLLREGEERKIAATPRMMQSRRRVAVDATAVPQAIRNGLQILPGIPRQLGGSDIIVEDATGSGRISRRMQLRVPPAAGQPTSPENNDLQQTMKQLQQQMQELRAELRRLQADQTETNEQE